MANISSYNSDRGGLMVYYFLGDIITMGGENVLWIRFGNTGLEDISCNFTDLDIAIHEVTVGLFEKIRPVQLPKLR